MPLGLIALVAFIQGITEFLPVSSSGHLVLLPLVSGYAYQGQTIDVAAHVGTLLAVLIYLRREFLAIIIAWIGFGRQDPVNGWLGLMLVVATIPVIIAGYLVNYAALDWFGFGANAGGGQSVFCQPTVACRPEDSAPRYA